MSKNRKFPTNKETKSNFFCVKFFITRKSKFRDDGRENDKAKGGARKKIVCLGRFSNSKREREKKKLEGEKAI